MATTRQHFHEELARLEGAAMGGLDLVATQLERVLEALERIGDNAVDIGEQTAFVVTGLFREFSDSSTPVARSG